MEKLFQSVNEGEEWFYTCFGKDKTFDATARSLHLWDMPVLLLYINGLIDGDTITTLLTEMQGAKGKEDRDEEDGGERFLSFFPYHAVSTVEDRDELLTAILSGQAAFITPDGYVFTIDIRSYPGRQPAEPDNEKVVRGSRDGFTENLIQNTALIRRRLRTEDLRFEMHKVTMNGKTDVSITYMQGAASEEHLAYIRERLDEIHHDGLTMTDKSLEEFLFKQRFHPMPFVRFTERPDICAAHLLEGHIAIIVDTSPSVILVPATIISSSATCGRIPSGTAYWNVCQDYAFICGCHESCSFTILVLNRNETTLLTRFPQLYRTERHRGNPITCSASYRRWRNRDTSYGGYSYADPDVDRDGTCCSDRHWTSSDRRWSFHP